MDVQQVRRDFPILDQKVRGGRPLVYLDSAATSQKPAVVIDAITQYYREYNANVHRAIHELGERATEAYERTRQKVASFLHAPSERQIVFTKNATEAINLVAHSWGRKFLKAGDVVVLTPMEHHSNLVPWQLLAAAVGIRLRFIELTPDGRLDEASWRQLLSEEPRLVALTHASNVLGTINPVKEIIRFAHEHGALVLVDGAQSAPHMPVDVQELDVDFFAFSAHKMCGPTGVGVLYAKEELLEQMDPFLGGGDMIRSVSLQQSEWNSLPYKFEAGTPHIAGVVGFGAAIDYLQGIGMAAIEEHERAVTAYAMERLSSIQGLTIYGPRENRGGLVAFNLEDVHPHDLATFLDQEGIAIRAGHHCAQPLMNWLQVPATARASFYLYTTHEEIDRLVEGLVKAKEFFGHVA